MSANEAVLYALIQLDLARIKTESIQVIRAINLLEKAFPQWKKD
jgi:glucose-6-phosphate isomerase